MFKQFNTKPAKCQLYPKFEADNVCGVLRTLPAKNTVLCKSIAIGSSHRFGIGNSLHKLGSKNIVATEVVPFLFVSGLIFGTVFGLLFTPVLLATFFMIFLYLVLSLYFSIVETIKQKEISLLFFIPLIFFIIHIRYGWGYLTGIVMFFVLGRKSVKLDFNR